MLPYRVEGSGPPLLLIHGWGVTYTVWGKLVPLLSPHFQLILVELPGVGAASEVMPNRPYYQGCAEALEELRIALGFEQWSVLAYSVGTRAGEAYVLLYPRRVTRIVFLCPIYLRRSWMMALQAEQWIDGRRAGLANWFLSGWRLYGMLLALGFNLQSRDYARAWMSEINMQPVNNLKRMLLELPGKGRAPFLLPVSPPVPALFIWGRRDALTRRRQQAQASHVSIIANHSAPLLTPEQIAAVVLPFLQGEGAIAVL